MTWRFENQEQDYRDYELCLPDVGEHGGRLRLTFALDSGTAYMVIVLDDMDGTHYAEHTINTIPLAWANAIASGVDGYTMASPAPVRRCACGYELRDYADTETQCGACAAKEV